MNADEPDIPTRPCKRCNRELPDERYRGDDATCITCRDEQDRELDGKLLAAARRGGRAATSAHIKDLLQKCDTGEALHVIINEEFGSLRNYCREFVAEIRNPDANPMVRMKGYETIGKMLQWNAANSPETKPFSQMSEDEIHDALEERLSRIGALKNHAALKVLDAK